VTVHLDHIFDYNRIVSVVFKGPLCDARQLLGQATCALFRDGLGLDLSVQSRWHTSTMRWSLGLSLLPALVTATRAVCNGIEGDTVLAASKPLTATRYAPTAIPTSK
jgi:hypothetical protein